MKKCCLLMFVLLCSCIAHAMHHEINKLDDVPDFCLNLERQLSAQPLFSGINRSDKGPCRVLQLSQQEEALFQLLSILGEHTLETWIEEECGGDPQGRAFFAGIISYVNDERHDIVLNAQGTIIKYGILRAEGREAKFDTMQRAVERVVKELKSGWHVITTLPCKDIPQQQGAGYIILRKQKDPSVYWRGREEHFRDSLIELLLEIFQLKDDVHHIQEFRMWDKPSEDPNYCARYLWFKPEMFERVQTCFGLEIAGAPAMRDHPANNVIPANPTPLHDAFDQEGFSLVGLFT